MATSSKPSKPIPAKELEPFLAALDKHFPNAETELKYSNNFELLVAVMLSAQATDKSVNLATPALFKVAPDAYKMRDLGVEKIGNYIKTIGLWRGKAQHVYEMCERLIERHNGVVPNNREELEALSGVGRKTANVVLSVAFGQPTMAVDTHIFRISNRTGLAPGKNVLEVEKSLIKRIPKEHMCRAHHWLILLGRYICKARKPECAGCPVKEWCRFPDKNF